MLGIAYPYWMKPTWDRNTNVYLYNTLVDIDETILIGILFVGLD